MPAGERAAAAAPDLDQVRAWLGAVTDPEIPVLTIEDLGMLRELSWEEGQLVVTITPTYSGCPAVLAVRKSIVDTLREHGIESVRVVERLAPAWTTDWMSEEGRRKLREYGIAPPHGRAKTELRPFGAVPRPECPRCGSGRTTRVSEFGSTACKALYRCEDCLEPFDYFKCI